MRRHGYIAANAGFGAGEILAMTRDEVDYWVAALSLHFQWVNEQQE